MAGKRLSKAELRKRPSTRWATCIRRCYWTTVIFAEAAASFETYSGSSVTPECSGGHAVAIGMNLTPMNLVPPVRRPLDSERFQVIVIGGGIAGVAIARACARAGRRTLLIEQHDFASGTTSRSTRTIHGGLRYLEKGGIRLVREALREQHMLLREYPHLVNPTEFLLPVGPHSRNGALSLRLGLWLYRRMGGKTISSVSAQADRKKLERLLDRDGHWSIFSYEDAQCEFPERLVAEWLQEACAAGAVARNHTQALAIDIRHRRAQGVLMRDQLSGREERVESTWVINATGPWVDRICLRSRVQTSNPMVAGVRGSHIVLPRFPGAPDAAVCCDAHEGRRLLVTPWNDQILVGTTAKADSGDPAKTEPAREELDYLIRSFQRLFPKVAVSMDDVRYAYSGVRPLPAVADGNASSSSHGPILRDHTEDGAAHLISVIGATLTTAAHLAGQCARRVGIGPNAPAAMAVVPTDNLDPLLEQCVVDIANTAGIGEGAARGMIEWHGRRAAAIAQLAASDARMRAPLCSHAHHVVAEAVEAFANEHAITLGDVLLRRVPVALGACWSQACGREAVARIRAVAGWTEKQASAELEAFEMERAAFLRPPPRSGQALQAAAD
jgi:glycerol-3-phosphate dehydrogenase